jgi:hypothetical protein
MKASNINAHKLHAALTQDIASKGHGLENNDLQDTSADLSSLVSVHAGATYYGSLVKPFPMQCWNASATSLA